MSPNLRRAAHQALDLILDALAEEQRETPKKRVRGPAPPIPIAPSRPLTKDEQEHLDRQLGRGGYKKTA